MGCTSLKNITFPEGLRGIGRFAFQGCTSLYSITFPASLRWIEPGAFSRCKSLGMLNYPVGMGLRRIVDRDLGENFRVGIHFLMEESEPVVDWEDDIADSDPDYWSSYELPDLVFDDYEDWL